MPQLALFSAPLSPGGSANELEKLDEDLDEEYGQDGFKWRELWRFMGPAWMVSIAYLDPGNLETDLQAGSQFSYSLCWVLLWSSALGLLIQVLALRLGVVTRRHLAQVCREEYPPHLRYLLWILAEIMIVASDVPEVIGTAFAIGILSKGAIPLWGGVVMCSASTLLFLSLSYLGLSYLVMFVGGLVGVMSICFLMEVGLSPPDGVQTITNTLIPSIPIGSEGIAVGLLGAVAMPHNLFLQSALVLDRRPSRNKRSIEYACFYTTIETSIALIVSFFVNTSVLLVAASSFAPNFCESKGQHNFEMVCEGGIDKCDSSAKGAECFAVGLESAGNLLSKTLGDRASFLWAIALLASGQSSTITGTYAGQFVMSGFVDMSVPLWLRNLASRGVAIVPSLAVSILAGPKGANDLVVVSSVVLALHLPLALVPLLKFTDSQIKMGNLANSRLLSWSSWGLGSIVVAANAVMLWTTCFVPVLDSEPHHSVPWKMVGMLAIAVAYFALLGYLIVLPVTKPSHLPDDVVVEGLSAPLVRNRYDDLNFSDPVP